jgi:hypothetical protein
LFFYGVFWRWLWLFFITNCKTVPIIVATQIAFYCFRLLFVYCAGSPPFSYEKKPKPTPKDAIKKQPAKKEEEGGFFDGWIWDVRRLSTFFQA